MDSNKGDIKSIIEYVNKNTLLTNNLRQNTEAILQLAYLKEDYGWVDINNNPINVGTWDKKNRIATLDNTIDQTGKYFVIQVNDAMLDGKNAVIGDVIVALNFTGVSNVEAKNLTIQNSQIGIFIEFVNCITITDINLINNLDSIIAIRSDDLRIINNAIETNVEGSSGIYTQYVNGAIIKNNYVKQMFNEDISIEVGGSYFGIVSELSAYLSIISNNISLSDSFIKKTSGLDISNNASCIALFSNFNSDIKFNTMVMSNNKCAIDVDGNINFEVDLINIGEQNNGNVFQGNNILIDSNEFDFNSKYSGMTIQGILVNYQNNNNVIKDNLITLSNNIYSFKSKINTNPNTNMNAIKIQSYNSSNKIEKNRLSIRNNTITILPLTNIIFNYCIGVYFNEENNGNEIVGNNILNNTNVVSIGEFTFNIYSAIYFSTNNTCNKIINNNLSENEGSGIEMISGNDVTEISYNNIMNNKGYGILLSTISGVLNTNTSLILGNNIINNGNYGLYITEGNGYNRIKNNNFVSNINKNVYDNNDINTPNYYCENFYSN